MTLEVRRTATGAEIWFEGKQRGRFLGNLDEPRDGAALDEMVRELFPPSSSDTNRR